MALSQLTGREILPGSEESDALVNQMLDFENTGETTEAPETSQEEVYIVKEGDTLMEISQDLGVPLKELAQRNAIRDVNVIMPGQEIRYSEPRKLPVETDISATKDLTIDPEGTTTAVEAITGKPVIKEPFTPEVLRNMEADAITSSDEGTRTDIVGVNELDFDVKSAIGDEVPLRADEIYKEPSIAGGPVVEEEPGDVTDLGITEESKVAAKNVSNIIYESLPEESKPVYKDVIDEIDALGFEDIPTDWYEKIAGDINDRIEDYNINISTIASEKMKPTFEGWDKFLAVLGSALGAYGSAMTGVPNFALQVINKAIDRDTQAFLKSKEARMKSLENQRLDLIMMRGEKLQMAQNRVTQIMQSETFKLAKTEAKANIKAIYDKLAQELALTRENYKLVMAGMIKDFMISDATLRSALSKEERKRYVNSFSATDPEGNTVIIPGYIARDAKSAEKLTEEQKATQDALDQIALIDELYESNEKYIPAWLGGKVSQQIDVIAGDLELTFKKIKGMGANYTMYEADLIRSILPTSSLLDKISRYKTKSTMLKNKLINNLKINAKVRGVTGISSEPLLATQTNIEKFKGKKISN